MTRGRKGEWSDSELAQWIREQLHGREKQWLISALEKRGLGRSAAAALVNRWTWRGHPESAAKLRDENIARLTEIFGQAPPGVVFALRAASRDVFADIDDLRRRVDALEERESRRGRSATRKGSR